MKKKKDRPKFRIIENAPMIEIDEEAFLDDYVNSDLRIDQLREKYGLSEKEYCHYRDKMRSKGYHKKGTPKYRTAKYYKFNNKAWIVNKYIDGEMEYFGRFETEEDAKKIVEGLKKYKWNKSKIPQICKEYGVVRRKYGVEV